MNLHHLNQIEECIGTYTFNSSIGKSAIDHLIVNNELMGKYKGMHVDENKELLNISDHCLVRAWFKLGEGERTRWKKNIKTKNVICIKKDEESLEKFVKALKPKLGKKLDSETSWGKLRQPLIPH